MDNPTDGTDLTDELMESGIDLNSGVKIWSDISMVSPIEIAASFSAILTALAFAALNLGSIFILVSSFWMLVKARYRAALVSLLIPPVGLLILGLALNAGPYATLGLWSGLAIAGAAYGISKRVLIWNIIRKLPLGVDLPSRRRSLPRIMLSSGNSNESLLRKATDQRW